MPSPGDSPPGFRFGIGSTIAFALLGLCALPFVAYGFYMGVVVTVLSSIGTNDGPHYAPFWLMILLPIGGGLLLISGIMYILSQLSGPRSKG
jgi:uncharacterized membrane protein